jgi:hypothetical protein
MSRFNREQFHYSVYVGGLALIAAALPVSVYFMSVGQLLIAGNWILQGRLSEKLSRFLANRPALVFSTVYLLYIIGFFYSSDASFAVSTLKSKLPLFSLVFLVSSSPPLHQGTKKWLLLVFSASITVLSFISVGLLLWGDVSDYRDLSPFVSHIRIGLMTALSVVLLVWLSLVKGSGMTFGAGHSDGPGEGRFPLESMYGRTRFWRPALLVLAAWHLAYLFLLQSLSGIIALVAVLAIMGLWAIVSGSRLQRIFSTLALSALAMLVSGLLYWGWSQVALDHREDLGRLESHTALGYPYEHDMISTFRENGYLVYIYIAPEELQQAWEERSEVGYMESDRRGQELRYTLFRFLTSKGLRKDAAGLAQLTDEEIMAVEDGVANVNYLHWPGLMIRIHQTFWEVSEFRREGKPEGHSLSQRLEYWKAAKEAIVRKPWFGWGTGDYLLAMQYGLDRVESRLEFRSHMKPHNQYLSMMVLFGIVGLAWFLFAVFFPAVRLNSFQHLPFLAFFVIFMVSLFIDDTMETQAGLTFFVFFYNFFLFLKEKSG